MIHCVDLNIIEDTRTKMIVNGVMQQPKVVIASCGNCGKVLFNFGNDIQDYKTAFDFIEMNKELILKQMKYCPQCGKEILLPSLISEDASQSFQD